MNSDNLNASLILLGFKYYEPNCFVKNDITILLNRAHHQMHISKSSIKYKNFISINKALSIIVKLL